MDRRFAALIESVHASHKRLLAAPALTAPTALKDAPKQGTWPLLRRQKAEIGKQSMRYVEAADPLRQAMPEICVPAVLRAPCNNFDTHYESSIMKILPVIALVLIAGCATSSHVIVGKVRPAITPDQVKLYTKPPAKYEEVAILDASSKRSFTFGDQGKTDKVIERLKQQAASLGANGVLLQGMGESYSGSVGTGLGSTSFSGSSAMGIGFGVSGDTTDKTGHGLAIYVPQP